MIDHYLNNIRKQCWDLITKEYPEEKDKYTIVNDLLNDSARTAAVVLDAGCGHYTIKIQRNSRATVIGIDLIVDDIKKNESINLGVCSALTSIPLKDASVDVIVCNMVFEHLQKPIPVFLELSRVLRKGGHLIFMTPCVYNIVVACTRLIPNRFHRYLGSRLIGIRDSDMFPTFYRANSVSKIRGLFGKTNCVEKELIMYQPPPFAFVFSKILCRAAIYYYRLINHYDRLRFLRGVIIGRYEKV